MVNIQRKINDEKENEKGEKIIIKKPK